MSIRQQMSRKSQQLLTAAATALNDEARLWQQYNENVVSQWRGKPQFVTFIVRTRDGIDVQMRYRGDHAMKWVWTDKGTEPHVIRPKAPGYPLRFQRGYSAYTQAVAQSGVGDGSRFGDWVSKYSVNHPGTTPRLFTQTYAETNRSRILARIRRKLKRAME